MRRGKNKIKFQYLYMHSIIFIAMLWGVFHSPPDSTQRAPSPHNSSPKVVPARHLRQGLTSPEGGGEAGCVVPQWSERAGAPEIWICWILGREEEKIRSERERARFEDGQGWALLPHLFPAQCESNLQLTISLVRGRSARAHRFRYLLSVTFLRLQGHPYSLGGEEDRERGSGAPCDHPRDLAQRWTWCPTCPSSTPLRSLIRIRYVSVSPQKCTKFFEIDKDIFEYQLVEGIVEYHLKMHQVLWLVERYIWLSLQKCTKSFD